MGKRPASLLDIFSFIIPTIILAGTCRDVATKIESLGGRNEYAVVDIVRAFVVANFFSVAPYSLSLSFSYIARLFLFYTFLLHSFFLPSTL